MHKAGHGAGRVTLFHRDFKWFQVNPPQRLLIDPHVNTAASIGFLVVEDKVLHERQYIPTYVDLKLGNAIR